MTTGALMFAFNNEGIDYLKIAAWNAANIRRHLKIPVAVITDEVVTTDVFDQVIHATKQDTDSRYFEDLNRTVTWYNANRPDAWDLTPWDRTLLLDADYVIASDNLNLLLDMPTELMAFRDAYDMTNVNDFSGLNYFGKHHLPMWWATVMVFEHTNLTRFVFDSMKMIRANWQHYRDLYGINARTYRNDYALSIALGIVQGHTPYADAIPWSMPSIMPGDKLTEYSRDAYKVEFTAQNGRREYCCWANTDFHAMGKQDLGEIVAAS